MYKDESLKKYLDDLGAKLPAPGGGSAAALSAALGASLIGMVVNFTIGKPKYSQYEFELKEMLEKAQKFQEEFLRLVDLDVVAYQSKNIRDALDVPFMVARLCFDAIQICLPLARIGNVNLITDVAVAAVLLESGFVSAYYNVKINLKSIDDKIFVREVRRELGRKEKLVRRIRVKTEARVDKIIGR
jgi:methenyltetrahydrofolate cyclohydrolase